MLKSPQWLFLLSLFVILNGFDEFKNCHRPSTQSQFGFRGRAVKLSSIKDRMNFKNLNGIRDPFFQKHH